MKLYAQHGSMNGEKVKKGLQSRLLDGVIFSPRDISLGQLKTSMAEIKRENPGANLLFDPQYYVSLMANLPEVRLGCLPEEYAGYFGGRRRVELTREGVVKEDIAKVLKFQSLLPELTHLVSPNIYIPKSLDSRETAIALDFLANASECYKTLNDPRPLYVTLAVSRDALMGGSTGDSLIEFVDEITGLQLNVKGFYLLIGTDSPEARLEIFHQDVIAGWLYLNHTLSLNGYEVVNGYSDLMTPFLSAAGGFAGATGWWANLRTFSLNRFEASPGGGRLPTQRYLSIPLLNRISFTELHALRRLKFGVVNELPLDSLYPEADGSEPERNEEVLQSWEALKRLNELVGGGGQLQKIRGCEGLIAKAMENYKAATLIPWRFESKSNGDHLPNLQEGMRAFKKLAEIETAPE